MADAKPKPEASSKTDHFTAENAVTHLGSGTSSDPPAAPVAAQPRKRIGDYVVLDELGRGGMGIVYRAEDPALKREVALKVMLPRFAADKEARARFVREARAQAKVEHDHVAAIFQVGESNGVPFIAMPLLRGMTLQAALKARPRPPVNSIIRIGRELAEGLAAAHGRGLIHRDIKPANVWLEGQKLRVKILDFGLARAAQVDGAEDSLTQAGAVGEHSADQLTNTGAIVGTPAYMSPEQAKGEPIDHRSDLFSLGVMLYQMCTGQRPFVGPTAFIILAAVREFNPPPVCETIPDLPPALGDLITRLLAKNPDDRPPTAQSVAEELHQLELALSSQVRIVALDAIPTEPAAAELFGDMDSTESNIPARAAARPAPAPRWLWPTVGLVALAGLAAAIWVATRETKKPEVVEDTPTPKKDTTKQRDREKDKPKEKEKEKEKEPGPLTQVPGYGLTFGPNDVLEIPDLVLPPDGELTLEAFVTPSAPLTPGQHAFIGVDGLAALGRQENNHWRWYTFHGEADAPKPIVIGRTVHLAGVRTPMQRRLYLDGRLVSSNDTVTAKTDPKDPPFRIGSPGFAGTISEVRVSKIARYNTDFAPELRPSPDKDTLALYHLDDSMGEVARDSSGNNHHGKITGAKWQSDMIPADPDRVTAEWFLSNGSHATIVADGKIVTVGSIDQIPKTPFQVQIVNCNRNKAANDDTLRCLRGLRHLVSAQLTNCAATDKTLTYIKDCKNLEILILYASGVTDEGLKTIEGFKELKSLNITQLRLSEPAVRRLAEALPRCTIIWDGGTILPTKKP